MSSEHQIREEILVQIKISRIKKKNKLIKTIESKVPIMLKGRKYNISCYRLDEITTDTPLVEKSSYKSLCFKFNVGPWNMWTPFSIDV